MKTNCPAVVIVGINETPGVLNFVSALTKAKKKRKKFFTSPLPLLVSFIV